MRIKLITLITAFALFISNSSVKAQTNPGPALKDQTQTCLTVTSDLKPTITFGFDPNLPQSEPTLEQSAQPVNLVGTCQPLEAQFCFVVACVGTDNDNNVRCTTGDNNYDKELGFGANNYGEIKTILNEPNFYYSVVGGAKVTPSDKTGAIAPTVKILARSSLEWMFFAYSQMAKPVINKTGTAEFVSNIGKCQSVVADPFGVIFDSQSLEPLPQVIIAILDADKNQVVLRGMPNPLTTIADGAFNFLVEPGTYFLAPTAPIGYAFETQPYIHPNYVKAYSNIYRPDEPIVENLGIPEHRDIPLNPGVNPPYRVQPVSINYAVYQLGETTKITGKQSHPLTIVAVRQNDKELVSTTADRLGFYELDIANRMIVADTMMDIYLTKVDLTATAETATGKLRKIASIEAQPPYIEGVAVDIRGQAIPNARVRVKLKMSDSVFYETESDSRGVFIVPPKNMPKIAYYLEFIPPNALSSIKMTTSDFAKFNKDYLTNNNINLMTATKNGRSLFETKSITSSPKNYDLKKAITQPAPPTTKPVEPVKKISGNPMIVYGMVFVGIIIMVFGLLWFLRLKNQSSSLLPEEPTSPLPPL